MPDKPREWTYEDHLWIAATDQSSPPRQLTFSGSNRQPTWHPSGDRLAFVRSVGPAKPQVWVLPLGGGEPTALTSLETGATDPLWSPDGRQLLFRSTLTVPQVHAALVKAGRPTLPRWPHERPARDWLDTANPLLKSGDAPAPVADPDGDPAARREWLALGETDGNPRVTTRLDFLDETDLRARETVTQLYVLADQPGAEPRPVALGYASYGSGSTGAAWLADSRHIVAVGRADPESHPDRGLRQALYRLDTESDNVEVLVSSPDATLGSPTPSPDGRWIACTVQAGGPISFEPNRAALVPTAGGPLRLLTADLDRSVSDLHWNPSSTALHFTTASEGRFPLYRVMLEKDELHRLTWQPEWGISDYALGADVLVQVVTSPRNPSELHVGTRDGKISRPLTTHNSAWLAQRTISPYEARRYTGPSGLPIDAWLIKPPDFDPTRSYPLLVQIHGGPHAMWGPGEASMWHEFQYFAAQGYVVLFTNPRGSAGYGRDFQRANFQDWGAGPAADVLGAVDLVTREPWIDRDRQVLTGGSYGGYLTVWILAHDQRFRAAVAQRGVYDLVTFFGEGTAWRLVPHYFGGLPWEPEIRRVLDRESPLTYAASIRTPLLIQHGDVDFRTGVIQSQQLYKTLKHLGRPVEYVRYPRASHEMSRSGEPRQRLDSLVRYEEFFRRHLAAPGKSP